MSNSDAEGPHPRLCSGDDPTAVALAAEVLRRGGLVAFPTETVYGLGADALDPAAVQRIFAAKERPAFNPLIVHVADVAGAHAVAVVTPLAARLMAEFWPGPLTLVMPRRPVVPDIVSAGLDTVGVRVPSHPVAQALLRAAALPIAAPSANLFTQVSSTTADHVLAQLGSRVDLVLDGGPTNVGIESTVLDVTGDRPVLLRPGGLAVARIEAIVGAVERAVEPVGAGPRRSPGNIERHYAPRARLVGVEVRPIMALRALLQSAEQDGLRAAVVARDANALVECAGAAALVIAMPGGATGYARGLYAALHRIDAARCDVAFVERIPADVEWEAIADRLRRAGLR